MHRTLPAMSRKDVTSLPPLRSRAAIFPHPLPTRMYLCSVTNVQQIGCTPTYTHYTHSPFHTSQHNPRSHHHTHTVSTGMSPSIWSHIHSRYHGIPKLFAVQRPPLGPHVIQSDLVVPCSHGNQRRGLYLWHKTDLGDPNWYLKL